MNTQIKELLTKIEYNSSQTLTVQKLAKSIGMSASRFEHLFTREVGISPLNYIKNLRLQKVCELLETTQLTVKEVRAKGGISRQSHFFRDFKKKFGVTPIEYRENFLSQQKRRVQ